MTEAPSTNRLRRLSLTPNFSWVNVSRRASNCLKQFLVPPPKDPANQRAAHLSPNVVLIFPTAKCQNVCKCNQLRQPLIPTPPTQRPTARPANRPISAFQLSTFVH